MEVFGVPATAPNIAIALAGIIATLWGGSKVPWKAAIAKLLSVFTSAREQVADAVSGDGDPDPDYDVTTAIYTLHRLAPTKEAHALISQYERHYWDQKIEGPKPAETVAAK